MELQAGSLTPASGKVMGQILLADREQRVWGKRQELNTGKRSLANLPAFCDGKAGCLSKGRTMCA